MRHFLAAIGLAVWLGFSPVSPPSPIAPEPARAADFEVRYGGPGLSPAQAEAQLDAVAQRISGLWVPAHNGVPGHVGDVRGIPGVGEWALTGPFQRYIPTGETAVDPETGGTIALTAPDGYTYRLFRWNAALADLGPYIGLGGGAITVDPDTGSVTITAGPVRMVSPVPPDCPVTFGLLGGRLLAGLPVEVLGYLALTAALSAAAFYVIAKTRRG